MSDKVVPNLVTYVNNKHPILAVPNSSNPHSLVSLRYLHLSVDWSGDTLCCWHWLPYGAAASAVLLALPPIGPQPRLWRGPVCPCRPRPASVWGWGRAHMFTLQVQERGLRPPAAPIAALPLATPAQQPGRPPSVHCVWEGRGRGKGSSRGST
eukprot:363432-Chlamydomonas_euryale.AAC.6